jgi:hypothetical protein
MKRRLSRSRLRISSVCDQPTATVQSLGSISGSRPVPLCYGRNGMHGKQVEYSATVWDVIAIRVVECLSDGRNRYEFSAVHVALNAQLLRCIKLGP